MPNGALYIVRHGSTALNSPEDERIRGWADVPLSSEGVLEARHAARAVQPYVPTQLLTSDLRRAHDTARIMSVTLALTPSPTRQLRPWHLGIFTGQPIAEVKDAIHQYMTEKKTQVPMGGESFAAFLQRWKAELHRLLDLVHRTDQPIVIVTHARNLYALEPILFGEAMPVKGPPHPGAVVLLAGKKGDIRGRILHEGRAAIGMVS